MAKKKMAIVRATGSKLLHEEMAPLPVALTDAERLARGTSLVALRDEERKVEAEFDTHKQAHKEAMGRINARREFLEQAIRDRKEPRPVKIQSWAHYDEGQLRTIRVDSGEVLNERPLLAQECQEEIQFGVGDA